MRNISMIGALAIAFCGCSFTQSLQMKPHAMINDVTVAGKKDSGYALVAIDGKPVERRKGHLQKVEPFALIEPGIHQLSLEPKNTANPKPKPTTISAALEAGGRYRIKVDDESVYIVDDAD